MTGEAVLQIARGIKTSVRLTIALPMRSWMWHGEHAFDGERFGTVRPVSGNRPDAAAGVTRADQIRQPGTIMGVGGAAIPDPDQPMRLAGFCNRTSGRHGRSA